MDTVEGDPDYGTPLAYLLEQHALAFIYLHEYLNIFEAYLTTIVLVFTTSYLFVSYNYLKSF